MTRLSSFLGISLLSVAAWAGAGSGQLPEFEDERQPGTLRISGITDTDRVLLDGELIGDGKRIMRFGSKFLITPGEYTVTILSTDDAVCESHISVRENSTAVARCSPRPGSQEQRVD